MKPAIFLDRDGVICVNRPAYVRSWEEFEFLPGALEAMSHIDRLGWTVVIISNQSAVGRGLMRVEDVEEINGRMISAITAAGGRVDRVYFCPHRPDEQCACRKPMPGMLLRAANELGINLARSYLVGDAVCDVQAALAVKTKAIMVLTGRGSDELKLMGDVDGEFKIARDLLEAAELIRAEINRAG